LYDAGFQLSFLATLGIVLIYGPLSEKFKIENDFLGIKSIVLVTISAQLGVLGILIYTFDSISLISLLANVIILPALPIIMLGGALAVGGSFGLSIIGSVFALPTWAMLHLEILSIEQLAKLPWAIVEFEGVSIWWSLGYYLVLVGVLVGVRESEDKSRKSKVESNK
jgi:competence protein ComEC